LEKIEAQVNAVSELIEVCQFKKAIKELMELAHFGNRYFDAKAPWALLKKDRDECATALNICCRIVKALCVSMSPFLPNSSEKLWNMMGHEGGFDWDEATKDVIPGQILDKPTTLFKKLEYVNVEEVKDMEPEEKKEITIEALDLRIGEIEEITDHPDAEKLYIMKVNFGSEARQLVAGLKTYYTKEEMQGRKIVVVMNLKPAKLRGVESRGMLLAAEDTEGVVSLLSPLSDEDVGVRVSGRDLELDKAKKQVSFSEFQKILLKVGAITQDEKVDFGSETRIVAGGMSTALSGKQFALTLIKGKDEVFPLITENGGFITVHKPVKNGAEIK
jgi:methionyl-tRNA synthetase